MQMPVCANDLPIPILVYHQIDEAPPKGAAFRSLYVSPAAFARQMRMLDLLGYRGVSMSGLMPYLRGEQQGKVVGITFDDGFLNNLTHALPVLQRFGFSSTCYAVSQRLGQTNVWDQAQGVAQTPLMDAEQLRQWVAGGQEVGAHTRHHADLLALEGQVLEDEILLSKEELSAMVKPGVEHFCYPYGNYDASHAALAQRAGFVSATTTRRKRCVAGDDLMQLPRVPVLRATTLHVFWLKVATGYEDRRVA
jgi:peptidoglycan/xylan/chitin deacetylase (PgdA/CDA1 family)